MYRNFSELVRARRAPAAPMKRVVVAGADDDHALEAVFEAQREGICSPVLVGDETRIVKQIRALGYADDPHEIRHCAGNPSAEATARIRAGEGDFLMKGRMETADFLRPVLDKETGLNRAGFITHFGLMQLDGYHKLLAMSDAAVIPYPGYEEKRKIMSIGVAMLRRLGYEKPVVAALCAAETENPKMPETQDAARLAAAPEADTIVLGPVSFDLATSWASAAIKGYDKPGAGEADMLVLPNLVTGNVMSKIWNADERNTLAGCLVGADVPIALTSRSAGKKEKLHSLLLCSLLAQKG